MRSLIRYIAQFPMASIFKQMLGIFIFSLVIVCSIAFLHYKYGLNITLEKNTTFFNYYESKIRGYLFSGFISVGSFLLSLHTFVIVNLKDKLFDSDAYKNSYIDFKNYQFGNFTDEMINPSEYYAPLNVLSVFLNVSIWLSIITAVIQFTLGFYDNSYTALFCMYLALLTVLFLLNCLILIRCNIKVWLTLEQKNKPK
ncbi:hypothetical protein QMS90_07890 [Cronobacter sakazakii]|uniref:hypothetical protein n=1 Tax=Cronobacter sakazakii TaxID=28141 RepID=UPI00294B6B49|nr:hypothetical protein [Cronobacter sakazakii]